MAPMAIFEQPSLKRTSSQALFDIPSAKKLDHGRVQHHKAQWDQQPGLRRDASLQEEETAEALLTRSIGLALEAVGFETVEPQAMESFRMNVEQYMAHYLTDVRQSMLSCRRVDATSQDFLQALHTNQLSLRALLPHLDPPVAPSKSQFSLSTKPIEGTEQQEYRSISALLEGSHTDDTKKYIPKHFPDLPDKHTYQATPEFPLREQDPRKIRERATEEGRLGEAALRKLVTAGTVRPSKQVKETKKTLTLRAKRHQLWMETMSAVEQHGQAEKDGLKGPSIEKQEAADEKPYLLPAGHLSSAVNAEKQYWRKPLQRRRDASAGTQAP